MSVTCKIPDPHQNLKQLSEKKQEPSNLKSFGTLQSQKSLENPKGHEKNLRVE